MIRLPAGLSAALLLAPAGIAQVAAGGTAEAAFLKAYYLENEERDLESALALYIEAEAAAVTGELREQASERRRVLSEQLAVSDFARLVPEDTIAYVEINSPGEQLTRLLTELGLMGEGIDFGEGRLAISPTLVREVLGVRGAAVAITRVDPTGGPPGGVAILHPGDVDIVRGLLETAIPAGGPRVEDIGGHATYKIEDMVYVTMTDTLVLASLDPAEIRGVLARASGKERSSLATNSEMAKAMALRDNDLLFFCVNAQPVMPMVLGLLQQEARNEPELAMAMRFLDIEATRSLAGRIGVGEDSLSLDIALELEEGHQNLAFDLLRMPHIDQETLGMVPAGAAGFIAAALNPTRPVESDGNSSAVSAMDFGREIFGNLAHVALFAMPSMSEIDGQPVPDMALSMRVNDPQKSAAIWRLVMNVATAAAGGDGRARTVRVADLDVDRYLIEGVPVYLLAHDNEIIVTPSEKALRAALQASRDGESILRDPAFHGVLADLEEGTTSACAVHVGRAAHMALPFMNASERREIEPFLLLLSDTTVAFSMIHDDTTLGLSTELHGIPDVSGVVGPLIAGRMGVHRGSSHDVAWAAEPGFVYTADSGEAAASDSDEWQDAPAQAGVARAQAADHMLEAFEELNARGRHADATEVGEALMASLEDDAFELNNLAWVLLTEDRYDGKYLGLATRMSERSNELSKWGNWYYLDTYAHALFAHGKVHEAIEMERKAIEAAGDDERASEARAALKRFEAAAANTIVDGGR
jgi:hypothetical protein